jgi:hypothetical protein
MNRQEAINKIIAIGKNEDLGIQFCGDEKSIDFNLNSYQPMFKLDIQICYSSIKSRQCFYLNVPAYNLYEKELEDYIKDITKANTMIFNLNYLIREYL